MEKFVVKCKKDLTVEHCNEASTSSDSAVWSDPVTDEFKVPVDRLSRDDYIRRGPIRPALASYPETVFSGRRRSFQSNWFQSRSWLEYNKSNDAAYCFPCRIFGNPNHRDAAFQVHGFSNWAMALTHGKGFDKHSSSEQHMISMEKWSDYSKSTPVDSQLIAEQKRRLELGSRNRRERHDILPILVDLANTLARLRLPFRGHDESVTSTSKGVFQEMANCLARWNPDLAKHLEKSAANPKGYPSYTSPTSQNHLIHSCASVLRQGIASEVKRAKFFAICLDTTPDHSKQDQLSFIVRYVKENGDIIEALLDMKHVVKSDASSLFDYLADLLQKYDLSMDNVRGQGYDGCSTMSGKYNGLQARVKQVCPSAYFVHCYCHRLNLVVVDTCSRNVTTRNFFGIVEKLYDFIEGSTKRHGLFQEIQKRLSDKETSQVQSDSESSNRPIQKVKTKTLKSLSTTRWSTRYDNLDALQTTLSSVVATLDEITSSDSYDRASASNALCLRKSIDFEFCLCLTTLTPLLKKINVCSKYLQRSDMNISAACTLVQTLTDDLVACRNTEYFDSCWKQAVDIGQELCIDYSEPRARKVSCKTDSNYRNEIVLTGTQKYCVTFFFETLDLMVNALNTRFGTDTLPLLKSIKCLSSPAIKHLSENVKAFETLSSFYSADVDVETACNEYRLFSRAVSQESEEIVSEGVHEMYLYMVKNGFATMFPNLNKLYRLILTLPATSVSCERSFSALPFVKNKLRSTMTEERLTDLMVIAVEGERAMDINVSSVVEYFWTNCDVERR